MAEIGLFDAMYSARSLRRLKPDPVPDEIITKILDAAIRAPSAGNAQHWAFVVVRDAEQRRKLGAIYRKASDIASAIDRARLGCSIFNNQYEPLAFVSHVQELTKSHHRLRSFRVYFLFDSPLAPDSPNQPYRAEYQFEGDDPYPSLGAGREVCTLTMRQGGADQATLCVAFPRAKAKKPKVVDIAQATHEQLRDVEYEVVEDEVFVQSESMGLLDFAGSMGLNSQYADSYFLVGRSVQDIKQGQTFAFILE
jgi:hypothetical protein